MCQALIDIVKKYGVDHQGWGLARWEVYELEACVYPNCGDICSIQSVCQGFHTLLLEGRVGLIIQKGGFIHQGLWVVS